MYSLAAPLGNLRDVHDIQSLYQAEISMYCFKADNEHHMISDISRNYLQ